MALTTAGPRGLRVPGHLATARAATGEARRPALPQPAPRVFRPARPAVAVVAGSDGVDAARCLAPQRTLRPLVRLRALANGLRELPGSHDLPGYPARRHPRELVAEAGHLRPQPAVRHHALGLADA